MKHLDDGALRRLYDDPLALSEADRSHFGACAECGRRFDSVAADARRVAALLEVTPATPDVEAALGRLRAPSRPLKLPVRARRLPWRPALAGGLAAAAIVVLAITGAAQQLFTIAQPSQVAVVPVTTSELQAMPDLSQFGTVQWNGQPNLAPMTDAASAATAAGFPAPPQVSAPGVTSSPAYGVIGSSTAMFTFSAARAQAWAAAHGVTLPAMPAGLDGASLELSVGPAIVELFGSPDGSLGGGGRGLPQLAIGKMRSPSLQSTGPSVRGIEDYLLSVPGFPSNLAAQLRAIGDPATTLPLPVPVDRVSTQQVQVDGVSGTAFGDNTGLGAGVIWVKDGFVYGVAGTLSQDQVTAIAGGVR